MKALFAFDLRKKFCWLYFHSMLYYIYPLIIVFFIIVSKGWAVKDTIITNLKKKMDFKNILGCFFCCRKQPPFLLLLLRFCQLCDHHLVWFHSWVIFISFFFSIEFNFSGALAWEPRFVFGTQYFLFSFELNASRLEYATHDDIDAV